LIFFCIVGFISIKLLVDCQETLRLIHFATPYGVAKCWFLCFYNLLRINFLGNPRDFTSFVALLLCCFVALLLCCFVAFLRFCFVAFLRFCFVALLLCCFVALLRYFVALLVCYFVAFAALLLRCVFASLLRCYRKVKSQGIPRGIPRKIPIL